MAAGVTSTVWDIDDLVYMVEEYDIMSRWDLRTLNPFVA